MEDIHVIKIPPHKGYFYNLDTLRLFAMIVVFSTHCYFMEESPSTKVIYERWFQFSGIGVEFFIIVSGFFSAYTYKTVPLKTYMSKKIKRIIPTHWFCLIISMYLIGLHKSTSIGVSTPLSFLCLNTLIPRWGCANLASWTISTLMVLYVLTPVLIKYLSKIPKHWLLFTTLVIAALSMLLNMTLYDPKNETMFWFLYISPYFRIVTYSIGILLGLYVKGASIHSKDSISLKISLIEIAFYILMGMFIYELHKEAGYWYTIPIILLILLSVNGSGIISHLLKEKHVVRLAKYSFSFYLIHYPILITVRYIIEKLEITNSTIILLILLVSLISIFIAAVLMYHFIENKFINIQIQFKRIVDK